MAFRGIILTGLQKNTKASSAIFVSAAFFGITHGILQQSINAFAIGLLLGYIAVRAGSLLPTMVMHILHNGIVYFVSIDVVHQQLDGWMTEYQGQPVYSPVVAGVSGLLAVALLFVIHAKTRLVRSELPSEQTVNVE